MDINDMTADELVNGDLTQLECDHEYESDGISFGGPESETCKHCGHCRWF